MMSHVASSAQESNSAVSSSSHENTKIDQVSSLWPLDMPQGKSEEILIEINDLIYYALVSNMLN